MLALCPPTRAIADHRPAVFSTTAASSELTSARPFATRHRLLFLLFIPSVSDFVGNTRDLSAQRRSSSTLPILARSAYTLFVLPLPSALVPDNDVNATSSTARAVLSFLSPSVSLSLSSTPNDASLRLTATFFARPDYAGRASVARGHCTVIPRQGLRKPVGANERCLSAHTWLRDRDRDGESECPMTDRRRRSTRDTSFPLARCMYLCKIA